ncbi:unnamed protein product [Phytophthora lilii]|uniref:Unnamed protein product n=1 Tax=Phytophthora lilii TaxID=2077276 RepID=A0A9W6TZK8_9STRA|nr:unnamed protein product [Phytophthora lilii]
MGDKPLVGIVRNVVSIVIPTLASNRQEVAELTALPLAQIIENSLQISMGKMSLGSVYFLDQWPGLKAQPPELHEALYALSNSSMDVYTMDHRGTGRNSLLECVAAQATAEGSPKGRTISLEELPYCVADILKQIDGHTEAFSVTSAARDLVYLLDGLAENENSGEVLSLWHELWNLSDIPSEVLRPFLGLLVRNPSVRMLVLSILARITAALQQQRSARARFVLELLLTLMVEQAGGAAAIKSLDSSKILDILDTSLGNIGLKSAIMKLMRRHPT